jgi:hypothetical protein
MGGEQRHGTQAVLAFDNPEPRTSFHTQPGYPHPADATEILLHMSERTDLDDLEPKPIDERISAELERLAADVGLRSRPNGDESCQGCRYYRSEDRAISYCWHPGLRILVGSAWWCQEWEAAD